MDRFLYYALRTHLQELASIVERMIESEDPVVARAGATRACLAELGTRDESNTWIERCLNGSVPLREGAAEVFAHNIAAAPHHRRCREALAELFSDIAPSVRQIAARCFSHIDAGNIADYTGLVHEFLNTPAFRDNSDFLFQALDQAEQPIPELICDVCEAWLEGTAPWDAKSQGWFVGVFRIEELVIRAYNQAMQGTDQALQLRCLALVDKLLASGVGRHRDFLEAFER